MAAPLSGACLSLCRRRRGSRSISIGLAVKEGGCMAGGSSCRRRRCGRQRWRWVRNAEQLDVQVVADLQTHLAKWAGYIMRKLDGYLKMRLPASNTAACRPCTRWLPATAPSVPARSCWSTGWGTGTVVPAGPSPSSPFRSYTCGRSAKSNHAIHIRIRTNILKIYHIQLNT